MGAAGQAAAQSVVTDVSRPLEIPGYAGTNLPEADHTATGMNTAARQALADPNDAGGAVGRSVVEGSQSRPESPVSSTEPGIRRAEGDSADAGRFRVARGRTRVRVGPRVRSGSR